MNLAEEDMVVDRPDEAALREERLASVDAIAARPRTRGAPYL